MDGSLRGENEVAPWPADMIWKTCCYWVSLIKTKTVDEPKLLNHKLTSHIIGWCVIQILSIKGNERTQAAFQATLHQQRGDCTQEYWHHSLVCRSMSKNHLQQATLWNTNFVQVRFVVNLSRMHVNTINCWGLMLESSFTWQYLILHVWHLSSYGIFYFRITLHWQKKDPGIAHQWTHIYLNHNYFRNLLININLIGFLLSCIKIYSEKCINYCWRDL